jgi:hypothetical protein
MMILHTHTHRDTRTHYCTQLIRTRSSVSAMKDAPSVTTLCYDREHDGRHKCKGCGRIFEAKTSTDSLKYHTFVDHPDEAAENNLIMPMRLQRQRALAESSSSLSIVDSFAASTSASSAASAASHASAAVNAADAVSTSAISLSSSSVSSSSASSFSSSSSVASTAPTVVRPGSKRILPRSNDYPAKRSKQSTLLLNSGSAQATQQALDAQIDCFLYDGPPARFFESQYLHQWLTLYKQGSLPSTVAL